MLPLLAAEGIGKADGHYSMVTGIRPGLMRSYLSAKKPTSLASLGQRGEADAQSRSPPVQKV